ncbi:33903_t:CDS:2 [Gigaspora margarita]|uniref:33903_t:CDS:1 n=1 Tax=Gigaspora margarita TaxID=4874 RepID=A0ABM8W4J8_GIGMA|nr:33903_t:CDS:2 [Gigaspora margarita]
MNNSFKLEIYFFIINTNIASFLQLLSNSTLLQQTFAAITQNSQSTIAPISESTQTLPALSSAIVGVVNTSFKNDFLTFPVSVGDFVLQKISENIVGNWRKNNIKEACDQGIDPPPKPDSDDKMDNRSIASYETMRSSRSSILATNYNIEFNSYEANDDNDIFELSTITSCTTRSSRSLISTQLSKTSFNIVEVNNSKINNDDVSELSTQRQDLQGLLDLQPRSSRIPTRLSAGSNKIENSISAQPANLPLSPLDQNRNNNKLKWILKELPRNGP